MTFTARRAFVALVVACATAATFAGTALAQGGRSGDEDTQRDRHPVQRLVAGDADVGRRDGPRTVSRRTSSSSSIAPGSMAGTPLAPQDGREYLRGHHRPGDRRRARRRDRQRQSCRRRQLRHAADGRRRSHHGRDCPEDCDQRPRRGRVYEPFRRHQPRAVQLAGSVPTNSKEMIIFTDGSQRRRCDGITAAANARAAGTIIFAIGLGTVNTGQLEGRALAPTPITSSSRRTRGRSRGHLRADRCRDRRSGCDEREHRRHRSTATSRSARPSRARATVTQVGNVLTWTIPEFRTEQVTLTFTATHNPAQPGGVEQVNDSVAYTDTEGHTVTFGNPSVNVRGCPAHIDLTPPRHERAHDRGVAHGDREGTDDFGDPVAGDPRSRSRSSLARMPGPPAPARRTQRDDDVHVLARGRVLEPRSRHDSGVLQERAGQTSATRLGSCGSTRLRLKRAASRRTTRPAATSRKRDRTPGTAVRTSTASTSCSQTTS